MSCLKSCGNALDSEIYTLEFTINASDVSGMSTSISNFWTKLNNMNIFGLLSTTPYNSGATITAPLTGQSFIVPNDCTVSTTNNGGIWIFLSSFAKWFGISVARFCNVSMEADPNVSNITGVKIAVTILPSSSKFNNENDKLSAKCIGEWIINFLKQYKSTDDTNTNPMAFVSRSKLDVVRKCSGFSPEINSNIEKLDEIKSNPASEGFENNAMNELIGLTFTNIKGYENNNENYSNVTGNSGRSVVLQPSTLWEWIFMFSFPVSFMGAIFFGIISVVNLSPLSIVANQNVVTVMNAYVLACSIISAFVWFNMDNPVLVKSVLNPQTIKTVLL